MNETRIPPEILGLRHAVPYIRMYRGKTFVLKIGGEALEDAPRVRSILEQIETLRLLGIRAVLVHGGGPQTTALATSLGVVPRFAAGRRVTDERSLAASVMTLNGALNTRLLAACRALAIPAVGISGIDGALVAAVRRPPVMVDGERVDYGFVGDVVGIDPTVIEKLLAEELLPIVSPLACDEEGTILNVNADTVASRLAMALEAEKLILLTGATGILERSDDPRSLVSYTDLAGLEKLKANGAIAGGMRPKVDALAAALAGGVRRAHVVSHAHPAALLLEIFTNEGCGTMIVNDRADELLAPVAPSATMPTTVAGAA